MAKVVLALSGGLDSTVLLYHARELGHEVRCVFFNYGSKHNLYEWRAVEKIAEAINIRNAIAQADLSVLFSIFKSSLLKTNPYMKPQMDIPEAHFNDPVQKATIVPGRNLIIAAILAGIAQSMYPDGAEVWMGMHKGDENIYPDCRSLWVANTMAAIHIQSENKVQLEAPWIEKGINKIGIVKRGIELKVPFEKTRTCYKDQQVACAKCGACRERLEAFQQNDISDPLMYGAGR